MKTLRRISLTLLSLVLIAGNAAAETPFARLQRTFDEGARMTHDATLFDAGVWVGRCARNDGGPHSGFWQGVLFSVQSFDDPLLGRAVAMTPFFSHDDQYFSQMDYEQLARFQHVSDPEYDLDAQSDAVFVYDGRDVGRRSIVARRTIGVDGETLLVTSESRFRNCYLWRQL